MKAARNREGRPKGTRERQRRAQRDIQGDSEQSHLFSIIGTLSIFRINDVLCYIKGISLARIRVGWKSSANGKSYGKFWFLPSRILCNGINDKNYKNN